MLGGESGIGSAAEKTLYPAIRGKYFERDTLRQKISPVLGGDYLLPGYGEPYDSCGVVKSKVVCAKCGKTHLRHHHCGRKECPECYRSWAVRRARAATAKLEAGYVAMGSRYRPRHLMLSFPPGSKESYSVLLKKVIPLIHKYAYPKGKYGGALIGHPWRFQNDQGKPVQWKHSDLNSKAVHPIEESYAVYSPHVHLVMFGWLVQSDQIERETGVVVKMIDALPNDVDVFGALYYQLTHCGVSGRFHALRWFGNMSYNKFVKVKEWTEREQVYCEDCGGTLEVYTLEGDKIGSFTVEVTKYHYLFKPEADEYRRLQELRPQTFDSRRKGRWADNE